MDASNRHERLQMRQRGAGTRQINTVDFGISFNPTPRQSARNTPQPASQRRRSRTPLTARGALRRLSRTPSKGPTASNTAQDETQKSGEPSRLELFGIPEGSETRSRKRRKIYLEQENTQLVTPEQSQASGPSIGGRRSVSGRRSSALPIQIAEVQEHTPVESSNENATVVTRSSPEENKENAMPGSQVKTPRTALSRRASRTAKPSVSTRRTRSTRSSSRQSEDISILSATGDVDSADEVLVAVLEDSEDGSLDDHQEGVSLMTAQGELSDTTMELVAVLDDTTFNGNETDYHNTIDPSLLATGQIETPAPRSANIKRKRSSLKTPSQQPLVRSVSEEIVQLSSETSAQQEQSEIPTLDETQQTYPDLPTPHHAQATPHAHPASEDSFYQPNHDDEDETYLQPTSPIIPTPKPVVKKAPRKKKTAPRRTSISSSTSSKSKTAKSKGKRTTFPILTNRLVNTSTLPTITEEPEDGDEEDDASAPKPLRKFHDRPTPNAIDVLAQFCREDIEEALENLSSSTTNNAEGTTTNSGRSDIKLKQTAFHSFSQTLESTLFNLSNATEHRLSLEAQLKAAARQKSDIQARWMEVRRQREEVSRRLDEVRKEKEVREREREGVRAFSELCYRTEVELNRARAGDGDGGEGLEYKVATVAEMVSSRAIAGGGGLLDRVRGFNEVLEGMVGVLEGRNERMRVR